MTPLTVACVWVKGQVPYTVDYVTNLETMVRRFIRREFRFVCLTDRPHLVPRHIDTIRIALPAGLMGWWAKVQLFDPALGLSGRVLYLDLDTLVVDGLERVLSVPSTLALAPHAGTFQPKNGLAVVRRFNSSVMVWDAGVGLWDRLYTVWTPAVAARLWGDQDWIGEQAPGATAMPLAWFPRLSEGGPPWKPETVVVLCKKPKNAEAAARWPWFRAAWGGA